MGIAGEIAVSESSERADHLSKRHFQLLASFIQSYSGIQMPSTKATMVEGRLRRRVRATGHANLTQYCNYLFDQNGLESEATPLINAITTNKTDFFREPEHFQFLVEHIVPSLITDRHGNSRGPLKIWSAASSIGAEPYTLAIVLADLAQRMSGLRFNITATDICTEVLETAINGIYPEAMIAPVPSELRRRYVLQARDRTRSQVRIVPELRAMVKFARINLMETPYLAERDMDVIFCRNILIYFDKKTQQAVLQQLCGHLRPGGHLFLGHSESLAGFQLPVIPVGPSIFRRL